jgi:CRP/FNR family transcriptional regulator, cyclic AMP receptor protein
VHAQLDSRRPPVAREVLNEAMADNFLDSLTAEEADELSATGMPRAYGANVTLFHQGDEAGAVMVLLRGRVKVVGMGGYGREAIMALRGPGELLGELAAIDGGPRSATVTTLEPVDVLLVAHSTFSSFLERRPRVALVILRLIVKRFRHAGEQQAQFATHDVQARVAQRLLELAERFGSPEDRGIEIALPLTQEELASWAGASREAVSKALHQLRALRIVETGRRRVTVLDLEALRRQVQ